MKFNIELLRQKKAQAFAWVNATQFFGSLNDNVFKVFIQMFLIAMLPTKKGEILGFATIIFSLPYLFLTAYAGYVADRFSKKTITVILKYAELVIMVLGVLAFGFSSKWMLYILLFCMSAQSALFSPTKYGILPEVVPPEKLTKANSLLVSLSFIAIILGSAIAPSMSQLVDGIIAKPNYLYMVLQFLCVGIAVAGVVTSHQVWKPKAANPTLKPDYLFLRQLYKTFVWVLKDKPLFSAIVATCLFSMIAAFLQINLVKYGMECLGLNEKSSSFLFFFAAIGIALGAYEAGRLSERNIEFGIMPIGAAILFFATVMLGCFWEYIGIIGVDICVFFAGIGAGLFIVPLDTFLQIRLPNERRGEGLALNSFMSWLGILLAGLIMYVFSLFDVPADACFLFMAFPMVILWLGSLFTLKTFFLRFFVTFIVRLIYKVRATGIENVPISGPALMIVNHASYLDALLLSVTTRRRIRFLIAQEIYDKLRFLMPIFKMYGVIPVSQNMTPKQIVGMIKESRKALDDGYLVCIFAEGGITRTGTIREFKRGFERILRGTNYPIIPVYLGGSWGTIYHYYKGQLVRRWFKMGLTRYRVNVVFGKALPSTTDAYHVRRAVMELSCEYFNIRKEEHKSLAATFISEARRNWGDKCADDTMGMSLTYGKALIASVALARAISNRIKNDKHLGILLPTSCAGMIANITAALLGRSAVNLNFTTSTTAFYSCIEQCSMSTIVTSRKFLERLNNLKIDESKLVFIEDVLRGLKLKDKLTCFLAAKFLPLKYMVPATLKTEADDMAMVLFSSGSTGQPKGVMLSQHNVLSMIESLRMMLATSSKDHICGTLPLFHSFGIMGCIWYPLLLHVRVTMHPDPRAAQTVADIVRENKSTMIFGTPTFLSLYLRKATKEDFASLWFVLAGAEKLKQSLIDAYIEKYGIRPYEAYGATELSPGIAVSVPHGTGGGVVQKGWKAGRVGLPCPGIAMKVIDVDTGEEALPGQPGVLYLKGPNVMLGYLGREDLTTEVLKDGWYCTGDVAYIDEDGFIGLTDRLSRFSKIGGEMVPHVGVEEALMKECGFSSQVLAVCGVPDERKGERLVVLYTPECGDPQWLWEALDRSGVPNLWKPAKTDYYRVDEIPLLGTGKMDLSGVKKLAIKIVEGK